MFNKFLSEIKGYFGKAFVLAVWLPVLIFAVALVTVCMAGDNSPETVWQQWQQWADMNKSLLPATIFLFAVTLIAFVIHYLQVPITRLFEGYWPFWSLFKPLRRWKRHYYGRKWKQIEESWLKVSRDIPHLCGDHKALEQSINTTEEKVEQTKQTASPEDKQIQEFQQNLSIKRMDLHTLEREIDEKQEELNQLTLRLTQRFPPLGYEKHLMPTRLGNIYKAAELYPLDRYGIDSVFFWTHLHQVLPNKFAEQLQEVKIATDFFLLCSLLCVIFPLISVPYLIAHSASLALFLLCTLTLVLGWLFYEAALIPALSYAELIRVAFDLYHRTLLKQFNLTPPDNIEDEKRLWTNLTDFLFRGFSLPADVRFTVDDKKS